MRSKSMILSALGLVSTMFAATGCGLSPANSGVPGSPAVLHPDVKGTVFTIIFENHEQSEVLKPDAPTFMALSEKYGNADAYISNTHPSLPNYIMLTSGDTKGINNDNDPLQNTVIDGTDNLADQLDAAKLDWRAYMESMGDPCTFESNTLYSAHHNPFLYYKTMASDKARCQDKIVDFDANFDKDLAADTFKYMWISPNMCNDMHNCDAKTADAWLKKTVDKIQASPGYKNGGVIFILFDEGSLRILNAGADLATIVVSENLVSPGYSTSTRFDHKSYLATVEDIFGMPRLATTKDATPMDEFFKTTSTPVK
jgi:hypothetical protein